MKKSIVALAVSSAALASISAYAAEDTTVGFYGNIQYAYSNADAGSNFEDNGSTIGFKGESKVTDDVTAFFKYELEFKADQQASRGDSTGYNQSHLDQAYVGLKGSFGKVTFGTHDTIYNNAIQDGIDQFEYLGFENASGSSQGDTITYFSPSMSGFEVQVAAQVKGDAESYPDTEENTQDGTAGMAVLKYSTDMFSAALAYDSAENTAADAKAVTGLSVTVTPIENLSVTVKYETKEDTEDNTGISARYGYGMGDVYASYQNVNPDSGDSYNQYAAGITYSINSAMYVYTELGNFGNEDNSDTDTVSAVGITYVF